MALLMTRPEKAEDMARLVYAIREATVGPARDGGLNFAETVNAFGQAFASLLVGAYDQKEREIVLSMFPDLVLAYFPQWEKIYKQHRALAEEA